MNMPQTPVTNLLLSSDPLSDEAAAFLIKYKEEDTLVDYKVDFDPQSEKDWLSITVDVMSFANTYGGYLFFGIRNKTYECIGVSDNIADTLVDINLVHQKLNRHIDPGFREIRSRKITYENQLFVLWFIPESKGLIHIAVHDGTYRQLSGQDKFVFRRGNIFLRCSGYNQILDPEGLKFLVDKQLQHHKATLLNKISKVVEAPAESKILIMSQDANEEDVQKFILSNSQDAIPIKGMSFTVPPHSNNEVVASWIAQFDGDSHFRPPKETLWKIYVTRHEIIPTPQQMLTLAKIYILSDLPCFFWLRNLNSEQIKQTLKESLELNISIEIKSAIIKISSFLGKGIHSLFMKKLGHEEGKISNTSKQFPVGSPKKVHFNPDYIKTLQSNNNTMNPSEFNNLVEFELTELAKQMMSEPCNTKKLWKIKSYDCHLYAKDDHYKSGESGEQNVT